MPFNGSGTFNRNQDWTADRDAGSPNNVISATKMDDEDDNFADGLSNCLTRDGQSDPTANLPMATYKHTGVGNSSARTDYASAADVQDGTITYLTSVAGTDTITATAANSMSAYAAGQVFSFVAAGTNTGATTINLNSIGAKAIQKNGAALVAGDITSGDGVQVLYDGTQFQMLTPARTPVLTNGVIDTDQLATDAVTTVKITDSNVTKAKIEDLSDYTVLGNVSGGAAAPAEVSVLDEDNMASDSATALATQQSIKAYVDSQETITLDTAQDSSSGTSFDFTGIPAGVKKVTVMFSAVSTDASDDILIQLGDAGGIETSGYLGRSVNVDTAPDQAASTSGFIINLQASSYIVSGFLELSLFDSSSNTWLASGSFGRDESSAVIISSGSKTLSAELTQLRVLLSSSGNFDGGDINISYES